MTARCTALLKPRSRALVGETPTAHCTGRGSLKHLAKCLNMLRTTNGKHLVIRNTLTLCYISCIRCGGEHPPNFTIWRRTVCEALPARAWEGRQGQKQHL